MPGAGLRFAGIIPPLRDASWLGEARVLAWFRILAVLCMAMALGLVVLTRGGTMADPWGRPLGTDFASFWSAASLVVAGLPAAPWDPVAHAAAQHASFTAATGYAADYYAFFYPPPFLLLCLPLGLVPYPVALAVWLALTGAAYLVVMRALLPRGWPAMLMALAYPAVLLNAEHGQNGMLSTALMGGAALHLDRRPRIAGLCLGALCFKPQLALLIVPALVLSRRWHALAAAAAMAGVLCLASWLVLGDAAWRGFLADAPLARTALEAGLVGFAKMTSPFAATRLLGGPVLLAWAVQIAASAVALAAVASVVRRRPGGRADMAAIAAASCLATPFLLDYDLMLLAVPLAWIATDASRRGYLPWEKLALAAAFVSPLVARPIALQAGLPVAPLAVMALLAVVVRRARCDPARRGLAR